jgi:hypothetical protein
MAYRSSEAAGLTPGPVFAVLPLLITGEARLQFKHGARAGEKITESSRSKVSPGGTAVP